MSKAMTKLAVDTLPNIMRNWSLSVSLIAELSGVGNLHVAYQEQGDEQADRFFGSVRSSGSNPSSYALVNGVVHSNGTLSFEIGMNGNTYTFSGQVDFPHLTGKWVSSAVTRLPAEDGTWHATATPPEEIPGRNGHHSGHGHPSSR